MLSKLCTVCGEPVPKHRRKHCSDKCNRDRYANDNKEAYAIKCRKSHLWCTFKLSWEAYLLMYAEQQGKCKICGTPIELVSDLTNHKKTARVDHCHTTGKIRGLLCNECNKGLGSFKDNIESLLAAIRYIQETGI